MRHRAWHKLGRRTVDAVSQWLHWSLCWTHFIVNQHACVLASTQGEAESKVSTNSSRCGRIISKGARFEHTEEVPFKMEGNSQWAQGRLKSSTQWAQSIKWLRRESNGYFGTQGISKRKKEPYSIRPKFLVRELSLSSFKRFICFNFVCLKLW